MITSGFDSEQIQVVMQSSPSLRKYSNIIIEALVFSLTFLPIVILIWFYDRLADQIPVFRSLAGEVWFWAPKTIASVFRVPVMAIDLQVICLLMKYGGVKSQTDGHEEKVTKLTAGFWDWLRCLTAFKMAAESLEIVFTSVERLNFLSRPAWLVTWSAVIVGVLGAGVYAYKLWQMMRAQKQHPIKEVRPAREHLIGGLIYFNRKDPSLFVKSYLLNFGNKWVYVLIASVVAYPLIVFLL